MYVPRTYEKICFQIVLTGYEITKYDKSQPSATWASILKHISHILLVSYSALNPLAYCGELIYNQLLVKLCCRRSNVNLTLHSEIQLQTMQGGTLVGTDSLTQQLKDLDAQSRLLTGLQPQIRSTDQQRLFNQEVGTCV